MIWIIRLKRRLSSEALREVESVTGTLNRYSQSVYDFSSTKNSTDLSFLSSAAISGCSEGEL
jgi:hypothetical protein